MVRIEFYILTTPDDKHRPPASASPGRLPRYRPGNSRPLTSRPRTTLVEETLRSHVYQATMFSLGELKDRKVVQWALAYLAGAWVLIEVTGLVGGSFGWPGWVHRALIVLAAVGLLLTLVLAWYHGEKGRQRVSGPELLIIAGLLGIGGALSGLLAPDPDKGSAASAATGSPTPAGDRDRPSIAVLPLDDYSPNPDDAWFTAAMHEQVITQLAKISGLIVISRSSVMQYADERPSTPRIARELGVGFLLEGSATVVDDRVRLTVQLIDPRDEHVWVEEYDRDLTVADVFEIQDALARQIASSLSVTVLPPEAQRIAEVPTGSLEAYEYYERARALESVAMSAENTRAQVELLERAVALDPDFAPAWAKLARRRNFQEWAHGVAGGREKAKEALERAVALAPDDVETLLARGYFHYHGPREYERALEYFDRAQELAPSHFGAVGARAAILRRLGRWDEAIEVLETALLLDPRNYASLLILADWYARVERFEEADRTLDTALEIAPGQGAAYLQKIELELARSGDTASARRMWRELPPVVDETSRRRWEARLAYYVRDFERAIRVHPTDTWFDLRDLALTAFVAGDGARARTFADSLRLRLEAELPPEPIATTSVNAGRLSHLALAHALLGEPDAARDFMDRALELVPLEKDANLADLQLEARIWMNVALGDLEAALVDVRTRLSRPSRLTPALVRIDPLYDPLRHLPGFQTLIGASG